jgi:hypothetical protein
MSDRSYKGYYETTYQTSIEKAILAEDIEFSSISNVKGKFFLPVMTPELDLTEAKVQMNGTRETSNFIYLNIPAYLLFQFMIPSIESVSGNLSIKNTNLEVVDEINNLTLTFKSNKFTIPKGTTFLVEFLGGNFTIDKTCIIGLLTTDLKL